MLCPYLWTASSGGGPRHCAVEGGRAIDCTWLAKDLTTDKKGVTLKPQDRAENAGEALRLLYVALTRARHRLVVWYPGNCRPNPLGTVLSRVLDGPVDSTALAALDGAVDGALRVERVDPTAPIPTIPRDVGERADLGVAEADRLSTTVATVVVQRAQTRRRVDRVAAGRRSARRRCVRRRPARARRCGRATARTGPGDRSRRGPGRTPLASAPGGTAFGTLVHDVLEAVDFTSPTLADDLTVECADRLRYRRLTITATDLAAGLLPPLQAPLGGPEGTVVSSTSAQRPTRRAGLPPPLADLDAARIGGVLAEHLPDDDPFRDWFGSLRHDGYGVDVAGAMTGSIDLVARTADGRAFWLADYKTNQLGLTSSYGHDDVVAAMVHHHYPLQAALYLVALHRYLTWRVPATTRPRNCSVPRTCSSGDAPRRRARPGRFGAGVVWWRPPVQAVAPSIVSSRRARDRARDLPGVGRALDRRRARGPHAGPPRDEHRPAVILAAALAVRAPRQGHVCVDLATVAESAVAETSATVEGALAVDPPALAHRHRGMGRRTGDQSARHHRPGPVGARRLPAVPRQVPVLRDGRRRPAVPPRRPPPPASPPRSTRRSSVTCCRARDPICSVTPSAVLSPDR